MIQAYAVILSFLGLLFCKSVQPVLQFKLNLLASVFKKQRRCILEIVLFFTSVLTCWVSFLVGLSSLLLVDDQDWLFFF